MSKLFLKVAVKIYTETLASRGWKIPKSDVLLKARYILDMYPGRDKKTLAHIVGKCAVREAHTLNRSRETVTGWNARVQSAESTERGEWDALTQELERAASLVFRADLRPWERDAFFGILNCDTDLDLEAQYPGTTRNTRDQWRTRARRKVVALCPELRPWLKFHKKRVKKVGRGIKPVASIAHLKKASYLGAPEQC